MKASEAHAALRAFPLRPLAEILAQGPFLILAPHPDDESLGCGGLIAAACAAGQPPFVVILTDGARSHTGSRDYPPARLAALRQQEARAAVAALGLPPDRIAFLGLPDTASPMDGPAFDAAAQALAAQARAIHARTILATWAHDPHCDHLSAHRLAHHAAAATGLRHLAYPVWGWTLPPGTDLSGPEPTGFQLDIEAVRPAKRLAIAAHRSQYAGLITDAEDAFQLHPDFLALFDAPTETFIHLSDPA